VDVLEFFSQGMEYLSLCYVADTEQLTRMKMADSLCLYVEQAAFASFEMQMYEIPAEELSVEALTALYEQVALDYGFESLDYDPREFVTVNHYYTNPLYIISYVVSNDVAMQLYQLERENPGSGLAVLEANLATDERYLRAFLETAGLESPFAEGRLKRCGKPLKLSLDKEKVSRKADLFV
jgi:oligoendopeptidase F